MQVNLHNVATALGGEVSGDQVLFPGIGHSKSDRSASVKFDENGEPIVFSFAGDDPLALKDYVRERLGMQSFSARKKRDQPKPKKAAEKTPDWLAVIVPGNAPPPPAQAANETRWAYYTSTSELAFYQCRVERPEGKIFFALSYGHSGDGVMRWKKKSPAAPRPLYNLHLLAQYPQATVIICEGEKAADAAAQFFPLPEYVCVTSSNGAKSANKTDWQPLAGHPIVIWPDNDKVGLEYAAAVVKLLPECDYRILNIAESFGEKPEGRDAADAVAEGYTAEQVQELLHNYAHAREAVDDIDAQAEAFLDSLENPPQEAAKPLRGYHVKQYEKGFANGVYYYAGLDKDGVPIPPKRICGVLFIEARTRDDASHEWGYLLVWYDPDNRKHEWAMPANMFSGGGEEYRRVLLDGGLGIEPDGRSRYHLTAYIQTARTEARAYCVDKIGWYNGVYVTPDRTIGETEERVIYQSPAQAKHAFKHKGTLAAWQQKVAMRCRGNSRLVFVIACAFAPVLLELLGEESGGFHFRGDSSSGKSTLLWLAASIWGGEDFFQRWRTTINGLEGLATLHNDCLLTLDELAQVDPKEAGNIAYIRACLEAHEESRFSYLGENDPRTIHNRMGYIRDGVNGREFILLPESFKRELCRGYDAAMATKVLLERGILIPDADGKAQKRESLPCDKRSRCYVLSAAKLWSDES